MCYCNYTQEENKQEIKKKQTKIHKSTKDGLLKTEDIHITIKNIPKYTLKKKS